MLADIMKEFAAEMESPKIATALPNGSYLIPLEENLSLNIIPLANGYFMTSQIGPLPPKNREAFFSRALLGNLFGQGTRGAVIGINEEETHLTLSKVIEYNVDYKGFKDSVEDFINVIDYWREELNTPVT